MAQGKYSDGFLIAGNWKMHGHRSDLDEIAAIAALACEMGVETALCLPATLIAPAHDRLPDFTIGGQDCHAAAKGAHTGCIAASMLIEAGASIVIVGHSERRMDQHESSIDVCAKASAAHAAGLRVILCIGESDADRVAGNAVAFVTHQLSESLPAEGNASWLTIAYEPIWAIGTGKVPSVADVAEMHAAIRAQLIADLGEAGASVRILYGGSMNGANAADLLAIPNVGGGLVGGASLKSDSFAPIVAAANDLVRN